MRLVLLPQAMRVIVPPMTSQYLNVTKNSSLAMAIGYQDVVSVQHDAEPDRPGDRGHRDDHGRLLAISLSIGLFMNWYNARSRWWSARP